MTTTTQAGTVLTVFGTDVTATILALVGDYAADFDLEAAANGYRDYLAGFLPDGYTLSGNQVIKDVNAPYLDREAVREAVADDIDGFDISQYAKALKNTSTTHDDDSEKSKHSPTCQESGRWLLHVPSADSTCDVETDTTTEDITALAGVAESIGNRIMRRARASAQGDNYKNYRTAATDAKNAGSMFMCAERMYQIVQDGPGIDRMADKINRVSTDHDAYEHVADALWKAIPSLAHAHTPHTDPWKDQT